MGFSAADDGPISWANDCLAVVACGGRRVAAEQSGLTVENTGGSGSALRQSKRSTREIILEAAIELFTEQGAEVRLEDIAQRAGVSRQSVYVHFGSRTGLLLGMVQHVDERERVDERVQRVFEAPSALEGMDIAVTIPAEFCPVVYPLARLFMAGRYQDEAIRTAWADRMAALHNLFRALVEWLERDRVLAPGWDVETATDVLWAWVSWQVWEQLVIDRGWSKERYVSYLRMVLRRTFAGDPA